MKIFFLALLTSFFLLGCSQLSLEEKNSKKEKIDKMANMTIEKLTKKSESIQHSLDNAIAYAVVNWKVTKVPIVGAGGGNGVIIDKRTGERKYINVHRFDIGGGWGVKSFKSLIIINDETVLHDAMKGGDFKFAAGAEVAAGTVGVDGGAQTDSKKKIETHMLLDAGASATATVRLLYFTHDSDLN